MVFFHLNSYLQYRSGGINGTRLIVYIQFNSMPSLARTRVYTALKDIDKIVS